MVQLQMSSGLITKVTQGNLQVNMARNNSRLTLILQLHLRDDATSLKHYLQTTTREI